MDDDFDLATAEGGRDFLMHHRWMTGPPWERWLINRQRKKEGLRPFTH